MLLGIPLVVPVTPGYRAVGANLGMHTLVVHMSDGHGGFYVAAITRMTDCGGHPLCGPGVGGSAYGGDVPDGSTLVPVDAGFLAGLRRVRDTGEAD